MARPPWHFLVRHLLRWTLTGDLHLADDDHGVTCASVRVPRPASELPLWWLWDAVPPTVTWTVSLWAGRVPLAATAKQMRCRQALTRGPGRRASDGDAR